ncbi:endonuclease/exonuclease/phosphatase family protein [Paenibacillus ehimensis]|uniref:Endonuclease/exonuclease/phosphatase family protein n=1 Tax=Paenibacillus ehimensis TaxID=79264 RepID=A0ABT8V7P6_9BACL|nr:endonuclease/exonuclease/phosphatase family protein [Paenibacillus ehimensis]MDO3677476.1 endonuclease/exonuclease/phosphatase family protein [Paenibacillus ehimensis]
MELNVMTFNLRVNTSVDGDNAWPYRIRHAAAAIKKTAPLVVGTQEGTNAMLLDLDRELPGYGRLGEGRSGPLSEEDRLRDEGCAIYYRQDRLALVSNGQFWLSETPDVPGSKSWDSSLPRICTWACFEVKASGRRFYAFNTHFDHLGQRAREESSRLVLERIGRCREEDGMPVVLTGDFNAFPDNPAIVALKDRLADAFDVLHEEAGRTFHAYEGGTEGQPIDYLFAAEGAEFTQTIVHRDRWEGMYPSDHYPVEAHVRLL